MILMNHNEMILYNNNGKNKKERKITMKNNIESNRLIKSKKQNHIDDDYGLILCRVVVLYVRLFFYHSH